MSIRNITASYRVLLTGSEGDAMFQEDIQDLLSTLSVKRVRRYFVALVSIHPVSSFLRLVYSFLIHLFPMLNDHKWLGLSPFLYEFEVFDCPSHTARLCEAFWNYADVTHKEVL